MADGVLKLATTATEFPSQGTIVDRAGLKVDASGWVWLLNHAVTRMHLDFRLLGIQSKFLLASVARFIAELIKTSSPDNVRGTFQSLRYLSRSEHFRQAETTGQIVDERLISELRQVNTFAHYRLHYIRAWYCWCADHGFDQFDEEIARRLKELKIPGNETGHAVRTQDPVKGVKSHSTPTPCRFQE